MATLTISEIFGPTLQGEGPSSGRPAVFVRLGRCNLDCSWCDTPFTWDWKGKNGVVYDPKKELSEWPIDDVIGMVMELAGQGNAWLVVISGGEPLLQRSALTELCVGLHEAGFDVEIETNGTLKPLDVKVNYNVSPKGPSSGVEESKAFKPDVLKQFFNERAVLKFVVQDQSDFAAALGTLDGIGWPYERAWIMPEGKTVEEIDRNYGTLAEWGRTTGVNVSDRMHIRIWGDERGR